METSECTQELNYYKSVMHPTIVRNTSVEWWLSEIKTGELYGKEIHIARDFGKGNPEYDSIKKKLPAVTWNFLFNRYKEDANIIKSTGYMYYDIDIPGFDISQLDKSKIFCFFKSLSNQGKSIIVKVSGVTKENFKPTYKQIAAELGISAYIDLNAIKKTQYTVLTHDPNLFINDNSFCFNCVNPSTENISTLELKKVPSLTNIKKEGRETLGTNGTFFRYNNFGSYVRDHDFISNSEGYNTVSLFLPKIIVVGKRKKCLLPFCNNLVWLNSNKSREEIYWKMMDCNIKRCPIPLEHKEIVEIVNSIFKYKEAGTLEPILDKRKRKILFGRICGLDINEKKEYVNQKIGQWKKDKTKSRIYLAIGSIINKKVTAKNVAIESGLGLRTVKRYWPEFKEYANQINKNITEAVNINSFCEQEYHEYLQELYNAQNVIYDLTEAEYKIYQEFSEECYSKQIELMIAA